MICTVTVPNSTGGTVLHHWRAPAQAFGQAPFRIAGQISLLARPRPAGPLRGRR